MSGDEGVPADWGDSAGSGSASLAAAREENSYKKFERSFQIKVLLILGGLSLFFVIIDTAWDKSFSKDILVVILPIFSFVLGRLDNRQN